MMCHHYHINTVIDIIFYSPQLFKQKNLFCVIFSINLHSSITSRAYCKLAFAHFTANLIFITFYRLGNLASLLPFSYTLPLLWSFIKLFCYFYCLFFSSQLKSVNKMRLFEMLANLEKTTSHPYTHLACQQNIVTSYSSIFFASAIVIATSTKLIMIISSLHIMMHCFIYFVWSATCFVINSPTSQNNQQKIKSSL